MSQQIRIQHIIQASIDVKTSLLNDKIILEKVEKVVELCVATFKKDGKLLFCGNGGSAADAQHIAAEFSGRFYKDRAPLFAEALHVNTSFFTAVCNDYSFEDVFARNVQAMGRKGDILFAISTSGNSENVLRAVLQAKKQGLTAIGMTGEKGGKLAECCDIMLNIPSNDTPRIQESHIMLGHIICELVEDQLF